MNSMVVVTKGINHPDLRGCEYWGGPNRRLKCLALIGGPG